MTEFKIIPNLESYVISKNGEIKALSKIREGSLSQLKNNRDKGKCLRHYKEKIIKQSFKQRYWYACLCHNGIKKDYRVHRLIYQTYIGEIPEGMVIDHIDGNTKNNSLDNLRCVTPKENCNNPNTTKKLYKPVIQLSLDGNILNKFKSVMEASNSVNGSKYGEHIGACCNNKRKTAYGYKWKWDTTRDLV